MSDSGGSYALVLAAGRPVAPDRLAEIAWCGEEPPEAAIRSLRVYLTRLRQALGAPDLIRHTDAGYAPACSRSTATRRPGNRPSTWRTRR